MKIRLRYFLVALCCTARLATAEPQSGDTTLLPDRVEIKGVEFIRIPAGWFWYTVETVGQYANLPPDKPFYRDVRVWMDDYYIAKYEAPASDLARFLNSNAVTAEERQRHIDSWSQGGEGEIQTGHGCTLQEKNGIFEPRDPERHLPATYLTWELADRFARWQGFRLPSEAEWQKAARGIDRRIWPWGEAYPDDTFGHFDLGRSCVPAPIDAYPKGRSPYGLYNMAGNVSEFVAGWYNYELDRALATGTKNPAPHAVGSPIPYDTAKRITKGGRWSHSTPGQAIPVKSLHNTGGSNRHGVRFALDASTVRQLLAQGEGRIIHQPPSTAETPTL